MGALLYGGNELFVVLVVDANLERKSRSLADYTYVISLVIYFKNTPLLCS